MGWWGGEQGCDVVFWGDDELGWGGGGRKVGVARGEGEAGARGGGEVVEGERLLRVEAVAFGGAEEDGAVGDEDLVLAVCAGGMLDSGR